ncbi:MAG: transcription antitermination factor NusB [Pseudomonadota bacterium]
MTRAKSSTAPKRTKDAPGQAARRGAVRLLLSVLEDRKSLADLAEDPSLTGAERARAGAAASGVLRALPEIDALLAPMLTRLPPAPVHNILRLAVWEMRVDGVAAHAAVDGAVRQVRAGRHGRLAGLVNAVGRRVAREDEAPWAPVADLPAWLQGPVAEAYGVPAAKAIALAHKTSPPLDLTPRDPAAAPRLAEDLQADLLPTGSLRLAGGQVSALPGYDSGEWWVQDAAAAMPVRLLGPVKDLRVADICAAPGGKTMQLAAGGAAVTALDISKPRLGRLRENLARTGLAARVVRADALNWTPEAPLDAVVLDAPCSATGTLRRHPDLPYVRPDPDLGPLLELQRALLDRALGWLRPGGRLLYCVCSLLPAEGEAQVAAARARHLGLSLVGEAPEGTPDGAWRDGMLRLRPDFWAERGGMDGFFAAVLQTPPG